MKTKIKAIISTAAAAAFFSVGSIATAAVQGVAPYDTEETARLAAAELREEPEWIDAFNEALLEGRAPADPVYAAIFGDASNDDEIMSVYLEPASATDSEVKLKIVRDNSGDNNYNLWSGRFTTDVVNDFAATFTSPFSMDCVVSTGTSGKLVNKRGHTVNYKELIADYTFLENGRRVTHRVFQKGTGQIPEAKYDYSGSGKLIEKAYYYYMYSGDSTSPYRDVAVVHVVDKDYAQTAEYAALPYGGIIDCYTYVETSGLPEALSEEN